MAKGRRARTENIVQRASSHVEFWRVEGVELVSVEPVGSEEHGEEKNNIWVGLEGFKQAQELRLDGWVAHEDDLGPIAANDVGGSAEGETEESTAGTEDEESDISAGSDGALVGDVNVLPEWDLDSAIRRGMGAREEE